MSKCGVYLIWNPKVGKGYVGQSVNISRRLNQHGIDYYARTNQHPKLHQAFDKYGFNNFETYVLEECSASELNKQEIKWIEYYDTFNNGYNCVEGGEGVGRGVDSPNSKITNEELKEIISMLEEGRIPQIEIANKFNISRTSVSRINLGHSYLENGNRGRIREDNRNYCEKCGVQIGKRSSNAKLCEKCYGISIRGENHYKTSLNCEQVVEIKNMLRKSALDMNGIAGIYNVERGVISNINTGYTWRDVGKFKYPIRKKIRIKHYCVVCGAKLNSGRNKRCDNCSIDEWGRKIKINAKLNTGDVLDIKEKIKTSNLSLTAIATMYNLNQSVISRINTGDSWGDVGTYDYPIRQFYIKTYCKDCGVKTTKGSERCQKCANRIRSAKLTESDVFEIRDLLLNNFSLSIAGIARKFKVTSTTISSINSGKTWKDVGNYNYPIR